MQFQSHWAKINEFLMSAEPNGYFLKIIWDPRKNSVLSEIVLYQRALYRGSSVFYVFVITTLKAFQSMYRSAMINCVTSNICKMVRTLGCHANITYSKGAAKKNVK